MYQLIPSICLFYSVTIYMFIYFAYGEINIKKDIVVLNDNVYVYI